MTIRLWSLLGICHWWLIGILVPPGGSDPLTLQILSKAVGGGYDLVSLSSTNPTQNVGLLKNDPSGAMVTWVPAFLPANLSLLPYFTNPEVVLLTPRNESELIQTLEFISRILLRDKETWKIWRPTFFVQWRAENPSLSVPHLTSIIKDVGGKFPLDSDVFIYSDNSWGPDFMDEVYEVYTLGGKIQIQQLDLLEEEYHTFSNYFGKVVRRQNLRQAVIRPIAFQDPDYTLQVKWERREDGSIELTKGPTGTTLFETLQHSLNFSTKVITGNGWIDQDANGTWKGLAAQLLAGEGDISINFSTFQPYRLLALDFLYSIVRGKVQAFFREPPTRTIRNILISPLAVDLWLALLAMWTLVVTSMTLMYLIRKRFEAVEPFDQDIVTSSFLWILGTFCQQGWYSSPSSQSLKFVFLTGGVFGLLTFMAFSAALVPILSLETVPIKNVEELGRSKLLLFGDKYLPGVESKLKEFENYRGANYLKPKEQLVEIDAIIQDVVAGNSAFVTFTDGFQTVWERHNYSIMEYCYHFYSIPMGDPQHSGFTLKKGSEYKEIFNHKILMMGERGLTIRNLYRYSHLISPRCTTKKRTSSGKGETMEIPDVATAYFILGGGALLSLFQFGIECFLTRLHRRKPMIGPYLH